MEIPIKIDISTGDIITPKEISYNYSLLLEDRFIELWSYNLETVFAEKLQTVLARGVLNTRMRDFYDITTLFDVYKDEIDYQVLANAFEKTCLKRNTIKLEEQFNEIVNEIMIDNGLQNLWKQYQKKYKFASTISFVRNIETIKTIFYKIQDTKVQI